MGDLIPINRKGGGNGSGRDGGGEEPPSNPTPRRPRKPIIRNEDIKPFIEDPSVDPGLIDLIDLPLPMPILRREIRRQEKANNPVEKEIDLMKRYKEKPLLFWRDELGIPIETWVNDRPPKSWKPGDPVPLWSKQREIISALVQHRKVAVKSGHGIGKCRGWYDPILLADGSLVPANELIGKFFQVLSYKNGKYVVRTARAEDNGVKDCIRIYYKDGNQEIVTLNHPLWATDPKNKVNRIVPSRSDKREFGFREAKDLVVGDCIASPIKIEIVGKEVIDDRLIKFLAYVIGDGGLTQGVTFSQQDNKQLLEFKDIVESYGCSLTRTMGNKYDYDVVGRKGLFIRLVNSFGLLGKTSYEKTIPKEVIQSSDRQISLFLSRLYSTDGWVSCAKDPIRKGGQIGYSTVSFHLAFQIQYLLKRLGIYSFIGERWASWIYKGAKKKSKHYEIWITSKRDILDFCSKISIYGKEKQQKLLEESVKLANVKYTQKWKRLNIIPGFEWNEIIKIEKLEFPTVAIEVEDTHTFITPFSYEHNTHLAAGITLYLTYVWHATGMTTAPCFDKETEILTDGGWKFLKDLSGEEKVSQYDPISGEMTFVKPLEYYKVPYKGKLLGVKNQLVDALMTPDHRCWVKMKETRWGDKGFEIKYAKDIYKSGSWRVQKSVKWKGQESIFNKDWMEFLGFWFAEGHCGYHPERGSYNVGVTQSKLQNIGYVDDLFRRIGLQDKVKKRPCKKKDGTKDGWAWNIYSKELAAQFKLFGKSKVRAIPRWILELDKEYLEAFMHGFWVGDGTSEKYSGETRKGGWWALATSSNQLADDLLEICVKLGWVANKAEYKYKGEASRFGSAYTVSVWKRGHQAEINRNQWYEVDYDDFVYCVKVPTQLIMVRRNGKYHISGNSFRQVRCALWGEIHYQYGRARTPLGGKINQVSLDLGPKWFVEGFATDKPMDNITGIHEENIFVIVDEAGGVVPSVFESLDALLTSESTFVLYIGNPVDPTGGFADAFKPGSGFKTFTLSCYDCPNVRHDRIIYPKLTVKKWVDEKEKKWGRDSNLFRIRVLGEFPEESKDTLIPIRYIEKALERGNEGVFLPDQICAFGLDVARQGSDSTTYGIRYKSGLFKVHEATQKKRETETAGKMIDIYNEFIPEFKYRNLNDLEKRLQKDSKEKIEEEIFFPPINVDDIGVGGGVVDILLEEEFPTNGVNVAEQPDPSDPDEAKLFLNKRAQYYWNLKKLFEAGLVAIDDEELADELSKMKIEFLRSGKIKIVDKETIKKNLGGRSPDKAECMMLAFSMDYADVERELVRFL